MCVVTVTVFGEGPSANREFGLGVVLAGEGGKKGVAGWGEEGAAAHCTAHPQHIQDTSETQQLHVRWLEVRGNSKHDSIA